MTRHPHYHGDKLSRLAPPSELIECRSPCRIRGLAEGGRSVPMLMRQLAEGRFTTHIGGSVIASMKISIAILMGSCSGRLIAIMGSWVFFALNFGGTEATFHVLGCFVCGWIVSSCFLLLGAR